MNYIFQLQAETFALSQQLQQRDDRTIEFLAYLASSKFNHDAQDGSRTDWISTADVQRWIRYIGEVAA